MPQYELDCGRDERAVLALRSLYRAFGYSQYKMSKFEEYDLYVRNKDFLISDHVITFTDATGRLLALKPDVTLSIVKNSREGEGGVRKVYYNENVYRTAAGSEEFREITQVGLECIGEVDTYCTCEVLTLAARSLSLLSEDYVLELSHLDIVARVLDGMGVDSELRADLLGFVAEKNAHDIASRCREAGLSDETVAPLLSLVGTSGECSRVLPVLRDMAARNAALAAPLAELCDVIDCFDEQQRSHLCIDFSLINDMNYYNGIVFRGYLKGIPTRVLSGGRYDGLMHKMGKRAGAVGFAVYLDLLEGLPSSRAEFDADVLVLYDDTVAPAKVAAAVESSVASGKRALALRERPEGLRVSECLDLRGDN